MALKSNETNQISFDELEFEATYEEEVEYTTISGKAQLNVSECEQIRAYELNIGDEFEGIPEVTIFENKDKKYNSLRVRVIDGEEYLDAYANIPKPDNGGYIKNIRKSFDFYRTAFDFIYSILKYRDERNVVRNGEEINNFPSVNIIKFAEYVDQFATIGIRITEGNVESEYNSWQIYKME